MKKKILFLSVVLGILFLFTTGCDISITDNLAVDMKIKEYEISYPGDVKKEIEITDRDEKYDMLQYINELKPLEPNEMVNLALLRQIEIYYGDNIVVGIQRGEESYCYYQNKEEQISSLSHLPKELYDMVIKKLDSE